MASDTSLIFRLIARDEASPEISAMQERLATASAAIGVGVAAALGVGIAENLNVEAANAKLAAQLGVGPAEAAELSRVSAKVYGDAWGDSTETVNLAIKGVYQNIGDTSGAKGGLEGVTKKVLALSETFDQDLGMTTAAVGQLIRTGMAKDADEALDIVAKGLSTSADKAGDFLETLNEYPTLWRRIGLDGKTATGLMAQGVKAGAKDADQVADALGIFGEMALSNSDSVKEAYKSIGLDSDKVAKLMGKGGKDATKALQMTMDALRGTKNETTKLTASQVLFGDLANTMGDALFALDPASAAASAGMDNVAGAADKAMKKMSDSPAKRLEQFKRAVMQKLSEVGGAFVGFAMNNKGLVMGLGAALGVVAGLVMAVAVAQRVYAAYTAIATVATNIHNSALYRCIAGYLRLMGVGLMAMARTAGAAVVSAATTAAAWVGSALAGIGTWIAAVLRAAATAVAQFALMAGRAVIWAATMAAQWLIAMGPIGWVIAAVVGLVAVIIANWDKVKAVSLRVWNWLWGMVKGVGNRLVQFFLNWTIVGRIIKHWDAIKAGTSRIWNGVLNWVKGIPGRITGFFSGWNISSVFSRHFDRAKSGAVSRANSLLSWMRGLPGKLGRAVGSLGNLLVSKGKQVISGLWSGISGMGGWLWGKVKGFAIDTVKGAIDAALEIFSPSRVTKQQGRWIVRGLVEGLTGNAKQVKAASQKVADIVRDTLPRGRKRSRVLDVIGDDTRKLVSLANQQAKVATKLKAAQKKVADLIKARDKLAADVKSGILQGADITSMVGENSERGMAAGGILEGLRKKAAEALRFSSLLNAMRKKGVRSDLVAQIASAGVEGGMASAQALASASGKQIKDINKQQAILVGAAGKAGASAGNAMYDSGIKAAQGLVRGLKSQEKKIEQQMTRIAKHMAKAIRKALGIRSPSALMANEVGAHVPSGVWQGIRRRTPRLETDLRRWAVAMVKPVREGATAPVGGSTGPVLGGPGAAAMARPVQANLIVDGRVLASLLIDHLRGEVQRISGGNVQKALGRGTA
ncbi:phage tail tape measure protein [Streptomyces chartreusis]|uniref:phage tail tape measure protein n=1 Tax=Streptomyces chartreusis TaxID=1969 RepID=UPI0034051F8D